MHAHEHEEDLQVIGPHSDQVPRVLSDQSGYLRLQRCKTIRGQDEGVLQDHAAGARRFIGIIEGFYIPLRNGIT